MIQPPYLGEFQPSMHDPLLPESDAVFSTLPSALNSRNRDSSTCYSFPVIYTTVYVVFSTGLVGKTVVINSGPKEPKGHVNEKMCEPVTRSPDLSPTGAPMRYH
ncbi:hypothetical protein TNCV_501941 [Trichonephila clavipes]|nr:hypothetical protein TNCV_501941 [Trichonephila clavipes]